MPEFTAKDVKALRDATGRPEDELAAEVLRVDSKALDKILKGLAKEQNQPRVRMLKTELETFADKSYSSRFWATAVKGARS